ncbi:ABC transporter ATP-binding protein [Castellaniella sp.]|uniref:ABC transporter ATP-binding protein n=1 Tax=Castellaniella sp. TaxID=1955812 RepID=UPI0035603727
MTVTGSPIELRAVTKRYGALNAVDQVSLHLDPGECVILAGHNGAGKSTLIKLILGLIRPESGTVRVLGETPGTPAAARSRRHIGYLPETVALYPSQTGVETLAFYARLKGLSPAGNPALLSRVGIADAARRRVGGYSKGMRQRLALAQALLGQPRILLLDEPTSGLDPASRLLFYEIVRELRDQGVAILLSTHALAELEGLADRAIILRKGQKIADGNLSQLRHQADLPVRIRITLEAPPAQPLPEWRQIAAQRFERHCSERDKLASLRAAHDIPGICDLELDHPGLDEMYAQFLHREDA